MVDYSTIFFRKAGSSYASYKGERPLVKFTVAQLQIILSSAKILLNQTVLSSLDAWTMEVRSLQGEKGLLYKYVLIVLLQRYQRDIYTTIYIYFVGVSVKF